LDKHAAWQQLEDKSFESVGVLKPEIDNPRQVVLKGNIRLVLVHKTPFAAVDVENLQLIGDPAKTDAWRLAPGEVSRTGKAMN
jgi:hypothetical protein